jgi:hypothetical protein
MASIGLIIFLAVVAVIVIFLLVWLLSRTKGKVEINLDKYQFSPGDTITGIAKLTVKKPIEAEAFNVGLMGMGKNTRMSLGGGRTSHSTRYEKMFDFKQPLDGKKTYQGTKEYKFEIKIPKDTSGKKGSGNQMLDTAMKGAQMFMGGGLHSIQWYVTANLDMKGFDLSKKVKVNIA